jgi:uncharacterized membrane-anchored protein
MPGMRVAQHAVPSATYYDVANEPVQVSRAIRWAALFLLLSGILGLIVYALTFVLLIFIAAGAPFLPLVVVLVSLVVIGLIFSAIYIVESGRLKRGSRKAGKVVAAICVFNIASGIFIAALGDATVVPSVVLPFIILMLLFLGWDSLR